ncbi:MAG: DUF917 domain-containing protein [Candidatus Accumulibacter sp. UW20]|jgi:DUF917 family protein
MITLNRNSYKSLFTGSAFFSCGGGVPYKISIELMNSDDSESTNLISLDELSDDDWLCTVYAIGASGRSNKEYKIFLLAVECLEQYLGVKIKGLIPGEIGSEINAVWTASRKNIVLVDTDMAGGRAVPEEDMDIYGINKIKSTPAVVVNDQSDVIIVKNSKNMSILESTYRAFAIASGGYCYIASRPIQKANAQLIFPPGTISRSILIGNVMLKCKSKVEIIAALNDNCNSKLLATGKVTNRMPKEEPGFLSGIIQIMGSEAFDGQEFKIYYKNENIMLFCDKKCLCSAPDSISLIDSDSLLPVSNSSLQLGINVLVFGTPALSIWKTDRGVELLGPKRFGFQESYIPL